ncbi:MAG: activator-dependent family glycosyltransferase [Pseudonocardiaceae bacterium]
MKVLFTTMSFPTHFYPMVPLAWALRTAGHEVRVASEPDLTGTITESGLTAVSVGRSESEWAMDDPVTMDLLEDFYDEGAMYVFGFDLTAKNRAQWTLEGLLNLENIMVPALLAEINNDPMVDDLVAFARTWQPDLVIWEPFTFAGAIAARATGAAHARLIYTPDASGRARQEFVRQSASQPAQHREDPTGEWLEQTLQRFGCHFDEEIVTGQWTIDPTPASMRLNLGRRTVGMRYVPYHGRAVVPEWMRQPPPRQRVCITLGLSGAIANRGDLLTVTSQATAGLDIEIVMTLDATELDPMPAIPDNVRLAGFVPLNELLTTCSAIVHHGGPGTLTTAALHGVPQVILTEDPITEVSAERIHELGAGLTMPSEELTVAALREKIIRVLDEPSFAENAGRIREEMLDESSPNEVVPLLEKLTNEHRATPAPV